MEKDDKEMRGINTENGGKFSGAQSKNKQGEKKLRTKMRTMIRGGKCKIV